MRPPGADVDGTLQVFHTDQVWNPTVATDTAGELTHSWTHDAWGANRTVTAMHQTALDPTIGFSSTVAAAATPGLVHMRARDYDPTVGQLLTPDPWQRPDGQPWVGVHAYVDGNQVSFWDPDGLRPKTADVCPEKSRSGGMTGCHVELWMYRNICETWVLEGVKLVGLGDVFRAVQNAGSDAKKSGENAQSALIGHARTEGGLLLVLAARGKTPQGPPPAPWSPSAPLPRSQMVLAKRQPSQTSTAVGHNDLE